MSAVPLLLAVLQAGCSQEADASPGSSPDSSSCCTPTAAQLFVIDPSFRDAFLLSNATPAYQRLWEQLPGLFVGTADQLVAVVEFMCMQVRIVLWSLQSPVRFSMQLSLCIAGYGEDGLHAWLLCIQ